MENFISCIESKKLDFDQIYARFHLGFFYKKDALSFSNVIRRILLTSIPSLVITEVSILGVQHELDTIDGVRETVFDIIENLKNVVFTFNNRFSNLVKFEKIQGFIKKKGPGIITAADIKISPNISVLRSSQYIASLSWEAELIISFKLQMIDPTKSVLPKIAHQFENNNKIFNLDQVSQPIKNVNYSIRHLDENPELEYIILDLITDGSIEPKKALYYSLYKATNLFYDFACVDIDVKKKKS
uniref:RNA polymerase subunit alpha n=1 Tax=Prototheca miyajii TaxID=2034260 RepID=UPI0030012700